MWSNLLVSENEKSADSLEPLNLFFFKESHKHRFITWLELITITQGTLGPHQFQIT